MVYLCAFTVSPDTRAVCPAFATGKSIRFFLADAGVCNEFIFYLKCDAVAFEEAYDR